MRNLSSHIPKLERLSPAHGRPGSLAPHFKCETCTREFRSQNAVNQHMSSLGHWAPKISCETCSEKFHTQGAADEHMEGLGHCKNYCRECRRGFMNENSLKMHLNSRIHRGSNIPCPFCKTDFTTASGLAHHLERASCRQAPGLNRETILQIVRERDPHGVITRKQIGWIKKTTRYTRPPRWHLMAPIGSATFATNSSVGHAV
ncbi:hypothetical protein MPDQ_002813 [Monascus purpureus]|uniref:C2H2-type domain-containing protein n=1 Tax=Monascus purpureus TaxID=5098 RepID=A0A507R338_MONPU|nr:hypothetical protein MPDQ_002813 [Monascus purpureus]BDD60218.1 hypothetical protein MAP00_005363 [Monascus purpureus]